MSSPIRGTRILFVLALVNFFSYAARNALFGVYPALEHDLGIGYGDIGLVTTIFMIPHAVATLVFGWAGDRYDRRRVIAAGMLLAGAGGIVGCFTHEFWSFVATRAVVGFGTAAVVPVANSIIAQVFEGPRKSSRIAIFNLGLFLGGVAGFFAGINFGFPLVLATIAIPGMVLALIFLAVPVPAHVAPQEGHLGEFLSELIADARVLLQIVTLRWLIASTTAMAFAAGGYNAWLKEFLVADKHMTDKSATNLLAISLFGGLAGILVGARLSDRWRQTRATGRLWTIIIGMASTVPFATAAILMPAGPLLYGVGILTLFFISWYHAPMAASVDDLAPASRVVAAQSLVIFTMHLVGTSPSSYVVGLVAERTSLRTAMWVPTVSVVLAVLCMLGASRTFAADQARKSRAITNA